MNPKRLLIILGVLIALFFVGTGWGVFSGEQSGEGAADTIINMIKGLQTTEPLSRGDVLGATPTECGEQLHQNRIVLAGGEGCEFEIGESSAPVRMLTLRLQRGTELSVRVSSDEDNGLDHTESLPLPGGDNRNEMEVQFMRDGGLLSISCVRGSATENMCAVHVDDFQ